MSDPQEILLSSGAARFTFPCTMTQRTGKNVQNIPCLAGLSQSQDMAPADDVLFTPDILTYPTTTVQAYRAQGGYVDPALGLSLTSILFQVRMQFLIGPGASQTPWVAPEVGSWFVWMKPTDDPEVIPVMCYKVIIL